MALVDAVTALGASELIALKWKNRRVGNRNPSVRICIGRRQIEELKETKSRNNPLPLAEFVLQVLRLWRENTAYRSNTEHGSGLGRWR